MPGFANLTNGSSTTSFVTASTNPAVGRGILVTCNAYIATGSAQPSQPTVTGNGITYTFVEVVDVDTAGTDRATAFVFRGKLSSASAGAITFSFSGVVPTRVSWSVDQADSTVDSGGANAANMIVAATKNKATAGSTVTTLAVNFVGSMTSGNGAYFASAIENNNSQTVEGTWTQTANVIGTSLIGLSTGYLTTGTDTGTANTWTTAARAGAILLEILAAPVVPPGDTSEMNLFTPGFMSTGGFPAFMVSLAAPFQRAVMDTPGFPVAALPGVIADVEPEAMGDNPVWKDGNDNLYRVMESDLASGNHPEMMKSTDGGITWAEVDAAHRPTAQDLEAVWTMQVGTQIIVGVNRDDQVWRDVFNTSDSGTPDLWGTQETVASGLSSTGVEQYVSIARTSDGQEWWIYSTTLSGANQQWGYKRRTAVNTYSSETDGGGNSAVSYTGPVSVVGAGDLTHIVYTDVTNAHLYYKTLTSGGTLSGATQIDSAGTSGFSASPSRYVNTNAVYYDDAGTEVISVMYADTSNMLKLVRIVGGTPQTPESVSSNSVLTNPSATTSDAIIAHLAVDGTTTLAIWADAGTGDIYLRRRAADGTWDAIENLWASGGNFAMYVYNRVFTRAGRRIMGYAYDVGDHPNDISNLRYNELDLGAAAAGTNAPAENAPATGAANNASGMVATGSQASAATGTANNATITTSGGTSAPAQTATATGTANSTTTLINAGPSTGTGTGVAQAPSPSVKASTTSATATGTAANTTSLVSPGPSTAVATGTASNATVSTSGGTNAAPSTATGAGTANGATGKVSPVPVTATALGTANNATVQTGSATNAQATTATATGTANGATSKISPTPATATASGVAQGPSPGVRASATTATGTGTTINPSTTREARPQAGCAVAVASVPVATLQVLATAEAAAALAQAFDGAGLVSAGITARGQTRQLSYTGTVAQASHSGSVSRSSHTGEVSVL